MNKDMRIQPKMKRNLQMLLYLILTIGRHFYIKKKKVQRFLCNYNTLKYSSMKTKRNSVRVGKLSDFCFL